jgi:hypothetical protein
MMAWSRHRVEGGTDAIAADRRLPCGALRYAVTQAPLTLYAGHCTKCQRMSSSAFQMSMPVHRAASA